MGFVDKQASSFDSLTRAATRSPSWQSRSSQSPSDLLTARLHQIAPLCIIALIVDTLENLQEENLEKARPSKVYKYYLNLAVSVQLRRTLTARLRPPLDVKAMRLTQEQFAREFGLELRTVQDWEQGRVRPTGAARTLLQIIERDPDAVRRALATV